MSAKSSKKSRKEAKIAPEAADPAQPEGFRPETPPPGWEEDPDAPPPELEEGANDEFLAASRKRREEAKARKGQRRYNLAIRVCGVFVILNNLASCLPHVDHVYQLSWTTSKAGGSDYAINHWNLIDADAALNQAPYRHYQKMYGKYDTASDEDDSYVLAQAGMKKFGRAAYCALVAQTRERILANGQDVPVEPWCQLGAEVSYAFLWLYLLAAIAATATWYLLLTGDGDVPPTRKVQYAPPDADSPDGKAFVITPYWAIGLHLFQASTGIISFHVWENEVVNKYPDSSCGQNVCPSLGILYPITLGTCLVSFMIALFYRAIAKQNHIFTLRKFNRAAKSGESGTLEVLKIAGQGWFLRFIDDLDPDGSGKNALHWAARRGSATMVSILVQSGADPLKRDTSGWCSMHYAARYGHEQVLKNLLGSSVGERLVHEKESLGCTPLHMCAAAGHLDAAKTLVNSSGVPDLDARNVFGQTPLMLAAGRGGKGSAVLDMLLTAGADPRRLDADGSSAFHYAAAAGSPYALERLLRATYRESLAPLGGRPRPNVTVQAQHNKWGQSAADEALARCRRGCRDLLAANLDVYNLGDRDRLKTMDWKPPKAFGKVGEMGRIDEDDLGEMDEGDLDALEAEELHAALDPRAAQRLAAARKHEEEERLWGREAEAEYPSDDERRNNDANLFESVLRRRLAGPT